MLQVKEGTVVQRVNDGLIEIGRSYGMGMKVAQTNVTKSQGNHPQYRLWYINYNWRVRNILTSSIAW